MPVTAGDLHPDAARPRSALRPQLKHHVHRVAYEVRENRQQIAHREERRCEADEQGYGKADGEVVEMLTWSILTRAPGAAERAKFYEHLGSAPDKRRATEDVGWALLNWKEFLFRR